MIWMYTVQDNEFQATDVTSLKQVTDAARKQRVWVDIFNPREKECEIISELLQIGHHISWAYQGHSNAMLCDLIHERARQGSQPELRRPVSHVSG